MDMIYARVPMPTIDEQRELKLENVKADKRFWSALRGMNAEQAQGQEQLSACAAPQTRRAERPSPQPWRRRLKLVSAPSVLSAAPTAPGSLGKPVDFETVARGAGFTQDQLDHIARLTEAADAFGLEAVTEATLTASARVERRAVRQLAKLASLVERDPSAT